MTNLSLMETMLMRLLAEHKGPLPASYIEWLVTGRWPQPEIRCDIVRIRREYPQY